VTCRRAFVIVAKALLVALFAVAWVAAYAVLA
jgi:hypothetical protein